MDVIKKDFKILLFFFFKLEGCSQDQMHCTPLLLSLISKQQRAVALRWLSAAFWAKAWRNEEAMQSTRNALLRHQPCKCRGDRGAFTAWVFLHASGAARARVWDGVRWAERKKRWLLQQEMEKAHPHCSTSALNNARRETNRIARRKTTEWKPQYSAAGAQALLGWSWNK